MKRMILAALAVLLISALPAAAETVNGVLMDKACSGKVAAGGYAAAKSHTKGCALMEGCAASGFGVVTEDGKYIKFDKKGDELAKAALEVTDKNDNITVTVEGKISGDNIMVASLKIT